LTHKAQLDFMSIVENSLPDFFESQRVLEIGSLDINGTIRSFFKGCEYTGLDVAEGPGVDIACQAQEFDAAPESYDVVICCEVMEHNPYWEETFSKMLEWCKPGGLIIMSCASVGRQVHGVPSDSPGSSPLTVQLGWDYYQNLEESNFDRFPDLNSNYVSERWTDWRAYDLYLLAYKSSGVGSARQSEILQTFSRLDDHIKRQNRKAISRYRRLAGMLFGERWFLWMRKLGDHWNYVHNS
jgi:SAM-dependent methyltransferase